MSDPIEAAVLEHFAVYVRKMGCVDMSMAGLPPSVDFVGPTWLNMQIKVVGGDIQLFIENDPPRSYPLLDPNSFDQVEQEISQQLTRPTAIDHRCY